MRKGRQGRTLHSTQTCFAFTPPKTLPLPFPPPHVQPRSFQSLFTEYQGRVDACWAESAAIQSCKAQADALYTAMVETPILDTRHNVAGEQARIMARALAMKDVLVQLDSTVAEMLGAGQDKGSGGAAAPQAKEEEDAPPHVPPSSTDPPAHQQPGRTDQLIPQVEASPAPVVSPAVAPAVAPSKPCTTPGKSTRNSRASSPPAAATTRSSSQHHINGRGGVHSERTASASPDSKSGSPQPTEGEEQGQQQHRVLIPRSSNEDTPDATTEECLLSVCLMLAALYEQTPFAETELRRRVFDDFTQLKRHFRSDDLTVLHGRTGSIQELFDSIKDLDKHSGLQNLLGIVFEDWKVNDRVSRFIMADQITVQVRAH